ncbi:MAG: alpha-E domain-containing protein [Dehalococcoidia bacterium]
MALLSRVAESLFWLGRYVERAENTARLLDVTYHGRLEPGTMELAGATNTWEALIQTLGFADLFAELHPETTERSVIDFLTVEKRNPSSIVSSLTAARENARGCRDQLSSETWVAINRLHHATAGRNLHLILADGLYDFCDAIRQGAQTFHGTAENTSLHDEGWFWLRSGVLIERADMVTRIVDSKYHVLMSTAEEVGGPLDRYQWGAVLRSVSGYEAFRRTHPEGIEAAAVVGFMILDLQFPRSLRASIVALRDVLDQATEGAEPRLRNPAMRQVTALQNRLQFETVDSLIGGGLHESLALTQESLAEISMSVTEAFFRVAASAA